VTKGSAPSFSASIDPTTNGGPNPAIMPTGYTDNNDVESRPLAAAGGRVSYDGSGSRVFWTGTTSYQSGTDWVTRTVCEIYLYGIAGQKLATYTCGYNDDYQVGDDGSFFWSEKNRNVYFAGKPVQLNGVGVVTDRLGSVRANANGERFSYFPYGEERTSTADGREKFGTYFRDAGGMDYADQRYYSSASGRFNVPDPMGIKTATLTRPSTWNRYGYTSGDPVNFYDPKGRLEQAPDPCWPGTSTGGICDGGGDPCFGGEGLLDPGCFDPGPDPLPLPPPPPGAPDDSCKINVATSDTPRDGQDISKLRTVPPPPTTNTLGQYTDGSGWLFAVQVQVDLFGDTFGGDWRPTQTWADIGSYRPNQGGPAIPVNTSGIDKLVNAFGEPTIPGLISAGVGKYDWLDTPGLAGPLPYSANLTYSFKSSLRNVNSGASCSINWNLRIVGVGDQWKLTVQ
jgi:RHS repeat-associated protein